MVDYMQLALVLAFQAPVICIIICIYLLASYVKVGSNGLQVFLLRTLTIGCILTMIFEILPALINYGIIDVDLNYYAWIVILSYSIALINSICWSEYCISKVNKPPLVFTVFVRILYFFVFVVIVMRIAFIDSEWFAYVKDGVIQYGILDDIQTYGCILINILTFILVIVKYCDKHEYANRELYGKLVFSSGIILFARVFYIVTFIPYSVWIGEMMVLLYLFMGLQKSIIFTDELTRLNNRRCLIRDINDKMQAENKWCYFIFDINEFKIINDNYGHSEGDRALILLGSVLGNVARMNNAEAYRYGGDEFSVLYECIDKEEADKLGNLIDGAVAECNDIENLPYELSVSYGYAFYDEESLYTIPDIMQKADENMYANKKAKKALRNS